MLSERLFSVRNIAHIMLIICEEIEGEIVELIWWLKRLLCDPCNLANWFGNCFNLEIARYSIVDEICFENKWHINICIYFLNLLAFQVRILVCGLLLSYKLFELMEEIFFGSLCILRLNFSYFSIDWWKQIEYF